MPSESNYAIIRARLHFKVSGMSMHWLGVDLRFIGIEISNNTGMTLADIRATLQFNNMLRKTEEGGYEIINDYEEDVKKPALYAKNELLTWVPYMVATKGDVGILNIPREHKHRSSFDKGVASSNISENAIISTSKRRARGKNVIQKRQFRSSSRRSLTQ